MMVTTTHFFLTDVAWLTFQTMTERQIGATKKGLVASVCRLQIGIHAVIGNSQFSDGSVVRKMSSLLYYVVWTQSIRATGSHPASSSTCLNTSLPGCCVVLGLLLLFSVVLPRSRPRPV